MTLSGMPETAMQSGCNLAEILVRQAPADWMGLVLGPRHFP